MEIKDNVLLLTYGTYFAWVLQQITLGYCSGKFEKYRYLLS
jgi:hypothetical protein